MENGMLRFRVYCKRLFIILTAVYFAPGQANTNDTSFTFAEAMQTYHQLQQMILFLDDGMENTEIFLRFIVMMSL